MLVRGAPARHIHAAKGWRYQMEVAIIVINLLYGHVITSIKINGM